MHGYLSYWLLCYDTAVVVKRCVLSILAVHDKVWNENGLDMERECNDDGMRMEWVMMVTVRLVQYSQSPGIDIGCITFWKSRIDKLMDWWVHVGFCQVQSLEKWLTSCVVVHLTVNQQPVICKASFGVCVCVFSVWLEGVCMTNTNLRFLVFPSS